MKAASAFGGLLVQARVALGAFSSVSRRRTLVREQSPQPIFVAISTTVSEALVHAIRAPGPHVPGWFPLVADRLHPVLGQNRSTRTAQVLGSRMELDLGEYMQRRFYYHCYEAPEVRFFKRWLRPGDVVLDVGAHVGLFTLLASQLVGTTGQVHAFEPVPNNFERLALNVRLNEFANVHLNRVAVGDQEGEVMLGLHDERLLGESTCDYTVGGDVGTISAPETALDTYLAERVHQPVRLVKIDVEGFEPRVLEGLTRTLAQAPPHAILLEMNAKMLLEHGSSPTAVFEVLKGHGYRMHRLGRTGALSQAPTPEELETAARRWNFDHEPKSRLRVGLGTRRTLFNAVAVQESEQFSRPAVSTVRR